MNPSKMGIDDLCRALTLNETQCKLLHELFPKICICNEANRKKRKPNRYNLHMKDCVPKKRKEEGITVQEAFKSCAIEYREKK